MPDGSERLVTAPFVDRDEYLEGMEWKRQVHAENGTTLIETYSWERSEGRLLEALAKKLAPHVTLRVRPPEEIYDRVVEMGSVDGFSSLLGTFLRHYKSGGYTRRGLRGTRPRSSRWASAPRPSSPSSRPSSRSTRSGSGDRIDFEDMVNRATDHVEAGRYRSPFRHILVDEFQDIAAGRARLIRALKAQHADARVFAVGDDWQSIYRFAGSDIHIMRNFGREFGGTFAGETGIHRSVDLGRTFRSVDKIALPARQFVLRNPAQITKTVVPAGVAEQPAIRVVWTRKDTGETRLDEVLSELAATAKAGERKPSVLLLGRYRKVDPGAAALQRRFPGLSITYKTIHSSKGLEADHVILLRADSGRSGFPSEMVDDPLLSLVSPEAEPFENAEERRVMYVAMTRARHTLTILASEARPSAFVTELMGDPAYGLSGPSRGRGPHPHLRGMRRPASVHAVAGGPSPGTAASTSSCAATGCRPVRRAARGFRAIVSGQEDLVCAHCGGAARSCPKCSDGWLVERSGRYGAFLGCVRFPECDGKAKVKLHSHGRQETPVTETKVRRTIMQPIDTETALPSDPVDALFGDRSGGLGPDREVHRGCLVRRRWLERICRIPRSQRSHARTQRRWPCCQGQKERRRHLQAFLSRLSIRRPDTQVRRRVSGASGDMVGRACADRKLHRQKTNAIPKGSAGKKVVQGRRRPDADRGLSAVFIFEAVDAPGCDTICLALSGIW